MPSAGSIRENRPVKPASGKIDKKDALYLAQVEIRQLKETVAALRDQLERNMGERNDAVQRAIASGHDEARQLQKTIQALRDELELARAAKDEALQAVLLNQRDEMRQLQATIVDLRTKLEETNATKR